MFIKCHRVAAGGISQEFLRLEEELHFLNLSGGPALFL